METYTKGHEYFSPEQKRTNINVKTMGYAVVSHNFDFKAFIAETSKDRLIILEETIMEFLHAYDHGQDIKNIVAKMRNVYSENKIECIEHK